MKHMQEAHLPPTQTKSQASSHWQSCLHAGDLALFNHRFYWQYDALFARVHKEIAAVKACMDEIAQVDNTFQAAQLDALQARMNKLKRIQQILHDRKLDDFKEIIYPMAKFVPALALFGIGGLSIVIGPVFALLFAGAFLTSNLYLKGRKSVLNIHFGIASGIQTTALILGILFVAGVATINPGMIMGLVAIGGTWLFCAAVFRGGLRQKEAKNVKMAGIDQHMQAFYRQLHAIYEQIQYQSISHATQVKNAKSLDAIIFKQLKYDQPVLNAKQLSEKLHISPEQAEEMFMAIKRLKLCFDAYSYDLHDYENLLRTVKNPFEKANRVADLASVQATMSGLQEQCPHFLLLHQHMTDHLQDTQHDVKFVMKKDLPWFMSNVPLLAIAGLSIPAIGFWVLGAPILLSPPALIAIGSVAVVVGLTYVGFHYWEKHTEKLRIIREAEKQKWMQALEGKYNDAQSEKSDTLKKVSRKTPMLLNPSSKKINQHAHDPSHDKKTKKQDGTN